LTFINERIKNPIQKEEEILSKNEENVNSNFNKISLSELLKGITSEINPSEISNPSKKDEKSDLNKLLQARATPEANLERKEGLIKENAKEQNGDFKEISMNELNSDSMIPSKNDQMNKISENLDEYNEKDSK